MPKFLVEYKHVEETTYQEWIEADTEDEALAQTIDDPKFEKQTDVAGIEMKDFKVIEKE